ncbi:hypothetical protein SAMN04490183_0181 [Pseudomonas corrugata]|nr:hypothetical protein SAMN04490183_0181 [Pseudomonas corrugata]
MTCVGLIEAPDQGPGGSAALLWGVVAQENQSLR